MQRDFVRLRVRDDAIYPGRGDTVLAVDRDGRNVGEGAHEGLDVASFSREPVEPRLAPEIESPFAACTGRTRHAA